MSSVFAFERCPFGLRVPCFGPHGKAVFSVPHPWAISVLCCGRCPQVALGAWGGLLDASEMAVLEHLMDMDLRIEASRSYGDYKKRYKRVYKAKAKKIGNKPAPSKGKVVVAVAEAPAAAEEEEEVAPPPKRTRRCDAGKSRHNLSKLRLYADACCITMRQIMINGKWHELNPVLFIFVNCYCLLWCWF